LKTASINTDIEGLQDIINKCADGLLVVDKNHFVQFINPAALAVLDTYAKEVVGKEFDHLVDEDQTVEIEVFQKSGKVQCAELRKVDIQWNGETAYLISIRDITKRVRIDRMKDDFIHNVSHELRTPLTSIRESVAQVHDGVLGEINQEQQDFLSVCLRNADHLRKIVDDLLDISKIEAGKVKLKKGKKNFREVVNSVLDSFKPLIEKKKLDFKLTLPQDDVDVYVDRDRIVQVMNNLVGNALKFTDEGFIGVTVDNKNGFIECSVSDSGRGISEEDLQSVFDKFQQFGHVPKSGERGSGLGLAISKEIVHLHGGKISVDSKLFKGSTFTFSVPRYTVMVELKDKVRTRAAQSTDPFMMFHFQIHNIEEMANASSMETIVLAQKKIDEMIHDMGKDVSLVHDENENLYLIIDSKSPTSIPLTRHLIRIIKEAFLVCVPDHELDFSYGTAQSQECDTAEDMLEACSKSMRMEKEERAEKRILIVDDEKEIVEATKIFLEFFGYKNMEKAYNGEEALSKIRETLPDLIILDMKMPGMSGYEIIGRLKENFETKDIPIMIMSGYEVETGQFSDYIKGRAILTVSKPADEKLLKKTVYYLL